VVVSDGIFMGVSGETLLPALIGLVAGAAGGVWAAWQGTRTFTAEWTRARQDVRVSTAVELIQNLSTDLAGLSHEMWWLTWRAKHDPGRVGASEIDDWEHLTHERLPGTLGMLAALRAFSPESCKKIEGVMDAIVRVISELSVAALSVRKPPPGATEPHEQLAKLHDTTIGFITQVRTDVGGAAAAVLDDLHGAKGYGLFSGLRWRFWR
jgi:hypothetical protein